MQKFLDQAQAQDGIELPFQKGVYLSTQEQIISDQEGWADNDQSKEADFTTAPFWITTDDGQNPIPIHDAEDLAELFPEANLEEN